MPRTHLSEVTRISPRLSNPQTCPAALGWTTSTAPGAPSTATPRSTTSVRSRHTLRPRLPRLPLRQSPGGSVPRAGPAPGPTAVSSSPATSPTGPRPAAPAETRPPTASWSPSPTPSSRVSPLPVQQGESLSCTQNQSSHLRVLQDTWGVSFSMHGKPRSSRVCPC